MRAGRRLSLIFAFAVSPLYHASAQTLPWPTDAPRSGVASPFPRCASRRPATAPGMSPGLAPAPGFGAPAMPEGAQLCIAEFTKLREDVEKKGKFARSASERKVTREEMCKYITAYATAEGEMGQVHRGKSGQVQHPPPGGDAAQDRARDDRADP